MRDHTQLRRFLQDLSLKSPEQQKAAIAKLSDDEREEGDLIMAGTRIEGGHGEWPRGSDTTSCGICGKLENTNPWVKWAWHPASFEI